jgi:tetratricopeptide (TPR) repeat protein
MIKIPISIIFCFVILVSLHTAFAENELIFPESNSIKEWESISAALVTEKRFNDAIIYLDKILEKEPNNLKALSNKAGILIQLEKYSESVNASNKVLEIDPNRISTLTNKAIALKMLKDYENSYKILTKILILEPDNENVKKSRAKLLSSMPTITTIDSKYEVHVLAVIRDSNGNLIGTIESTNGRYLASGFTENWWSKMIEKNIIVNKGGIEIYQDKQTLEPEDDHTGLFSLERIMNDYTINIFEVFTPMIQLEESDIIETQWTIIKR